MSVSDLTKYEQWVEKHSISLQMEYMGKNNILDPSEFDEYKFWDWTMDKWIESPEEEYFCDYNENLMDDLINFEGEL